MTPPSSGVALADALPDGRLEVIDRAGHLAMLETPDDFNEILDRCVRRQLPVRSSGRARRRSA